MQITTYSCIYLPTQFPNESANVPTLQVSLVHTLGAAPRRVSEPLQVKQCAGLTGLEQVAQESSHPLWSSYICKNHKFHDHCPYRIMEHHW